MDPVSCGRCGNVLAGDDRRESCVFCEDWICGDCWEAWGYCDHPGADDWQRRMREAKERGDKAAVAKLWDEVGPIGATPARWRRQTR